MQSCTTKSITGTLPIGSIHFSTALVIGSRRVPQPATGIIAFVTFIYVVYYTPSSNGDRDVLRSRRYVKVTVIASSSHQYHNTPKIRQPLSVGATAVSFVFWSVAGSINGVDRPVLLS